jgi:hypothetical protein
MRDSQAAEEPESQKGGEPKGQKPKKAESQKGREEGKTRRTGGTHDDGLVIQNMLD